MTVRRLWGQVSGGPSEVALQSVPRMQIGHLAGGGKQGRVGFCANAFIRLQHDSGALPGDSSPARP